MLTDLEFRVWTQYILSADDCGVMRMSALTLQADNDSLAKRPAKMIDRALLALVNIKLLLSFEHQGRRYVCDPLWQNYQKVQWPKRSLNPVPPEDVLAQFSEETRLLLERILKRSTRDHREGHRLEANGGGQKANGLQARFERFWEVYPRKVGKDAALREWDKLAPDNDLTDLMVSAVQEQRASAQWLKDGGQFIPHPRTWLHQGRWKDQAGTQPALNSNSAATVAAIQKPVRYDS